MLKRIITLTVLLTLGACTLALTACGTIRGFGQDVQHAGEKIEKAASK